MHQDIGQEIHRERQMVIEDAHVETGVLLGGERIHLPANGIDGARDLLGRPDWRSPEHQVLDQMGDPAAPSGSAREPVSTQTPTATERTCEAWPR